MNKNKTKQSPFSFLKSGNNIEFDTALKSMDNLYQDLFGDSQKYDSMFQTFKTQNNPITESIDQMTTQIFDLDAPKEEKYIKIEKQDNKIKIGQLYRNDQDEEQSVVLGEPCYIEGENKNPYFYNQYKH